MSLIIEQTGNQSVIHIKNAYTLEDAKKIDNFIKEVAEKNNHYKILLKFSEGFDPEIETINFGFSKLEEGLPINVDIGLVSTSIGMNKYILEQIASQEPKILRFFQSEKESDEWINRTSNY